MRFVIAYQEQHRNVLVIPHFIGASPRSGSLRDLLRRLCLTLKGAFGYGEDVPLEIAPLVTTFRDFLVRVPADCRVLIVLDALNQIEESDRACELYWLPYELLPHVKIISSCIIDPRSPGAELDPVANAFQHRPAHLLRVTDLSDTDRRTMICEYPSLFAKTLDASQIGMLLSNPATSTPLYLRVALEELRGFGSFDDLDDRIKALPRDGLPDAVLLHAGFSPKAMRKAGDPLTALFVQVIERLESEFECEDVRSILTLLASARFGLSDRELLELLEGPGVAIEASTSDLFPRLRQLRPYLQNVGGLLGFFHGNLLQAVRRHYLDTDDQRRTAHARLGDYFEPQTTWLESPDAFWERARHSAPSPRLANLRKVDELVWQRIEAQEWILVVKLLTSLDCLEAKAEGGRTFDLAGELARVTQRMPENDSARQLLRLLEQAIRGDIHFLVRHPTTLFQCLWNRCWWYDCPESAEHYLPGDKPPVQSGSNSRTLRLDGSLAKNQGGRAARFHLAPLAPPLPHASGAGLLAVLQGHAGPVLGVAFSAQGDRIASGAEDQTVRVWDTASGCEVGCLRGHTAAVGCVAFSPDGRWIASGSKDQTLRLWDSRTGASSSAWTDTPPRSCVWHSRPTAGGSPVRLMTAPPVSGRPIPARTRLPPRTLLLGRCLASSPDGERIATGSSDQTLRVWDTSVGVELVCSSNAGCSIEDLAFLPGGRRIITGSRGGTIQLWDADSGDELGGQPGNSQIMGVAVAPDGRRIIDVFWDLNLRLHDTFSGHTYAIYRGADAVVGSVAFSPDGQRIASGSWDHLVRVWDAGFSSEPSSLRGHTTEIAGIQFSPDGRLVASHSEDGSLRVWDAGSGREIACCRDGDYSSEIVSMVFAPEGRWLAFTRSNGTTRVWDAQSEGEPVTLQGLGPGVTGWMKRLDFTSDARRMRGRLTRRHRGRLEPQDRGPTRSS